MSIGKKIKQLRELRNLTQAHMAHELGLSLGGYGKIERDETDITISRLNKIAEILDTSVATILSFDSNQVFNQYHNKTATANGVVKNLQIISDQGLDEVFKSMKDEIEMLKSQINDIRR